METDANELLRLAAPYSPIIRAYLANQNPLVVTLMLRPKSFRGVDSYWAYGEDAIKIANNTDLVLHYMEVEGLQIPLIGVPHYGADYYRRELTRKGMNATWVC